MGDSWEILGSFWVFWGRFWVVPPIPPKFPPVSCKKSHFLPSFYCFLKFCKQYFYKVLACFSAKTRLKLRPRHRALSITYIACTNPFVFKRTTKNNFYLSQSRNPFRQLFFREPPMIVNVSRGKTFHPTLKYVFDKSDSRLLTANMPELFGCPQSEAADRVAQRMEIGASASSRICKPCYHLSISPAPQDRTLSDDEWSRIVQKILEDLARAASAPLRRRLPRRC